MEGYNFKKIKSFTDLNVWQEGHKLVLLIYKSMDSKKSKRRFYIIAKGSLIELQNQLIIARDLKYITLLDFKKAAMQTIVVHKLSNAFIRSAQDKCDAYTKY